MLASDERCRLTIVSVYPPLPATDGGRLDVLNQIKALVRYGVAVQLVLISDYRLSDADHVLLTDIGVSVVDASPQRNIWYWLRAAVLLFDRPLFAARRSFFGKTRDSIVSEVARFNPHAILSESLDPVPLASVLARVLAVRLLLRSQNIEFQYKADVVRQSRGLRRLRGVLDCLHLRRFERKAFVTAYRFFDISVQDLEFWKSSGLDNGIWLPPVFDMRQDITSNSTPDFDIGFVGNLHNHNNILGLRWFVQEVLPGLTSRMGGRVRLLVAGSNPATEVRSFLDIPGVSLVSDFVNLLSTQRCAHVLLNPMLTGGGVALKTVEMLRSGRPVVSTSRGAGGLPSDIVDLLLIADSAKSFEEAILEALRRPAYDAVQAERAAARFSYSAILPLIEELESAKAAIDARVAVSRNTIKVEIAD